MSKPMTLSASEREKVMSTIQKLAGATGKEWDFEILQAPGHDEPAFLQIVVNSRFARPIQLSEPSNTLSDRICQELERHALELHAESNLSNKEEVCPANPKYNGRHVCPQCGATSYWQCVSAKDARIRIRCTAECGIYEEPFSALTLRRFFEAANEPPLAA